MIKTSIGIACCKQNKILLACRRISYAYLDLILAKYPMHNISKIKYLLANMTSREHYNLITREFDKIWWDATHLDIIENNKLYMKKKSIFETMFGTQSRAGIYDLINLIQSIQPINSLWEIPKGKAFKNETDINAAIREFEEETNIPKKKYQIIFQPINYSYQDNNITYSINYYPAALLSNFIPYIAPDNLSQTFEICEIKWMDLQTIKILCPSRFYNLVHRIMKIYRSFLKQSNIIINVRQNLRIGELLHELDSANPHKDDCENQTDNTHYSIANNGQMLRKNFSAQKI